MKKIVVFGGTGGLGKKLIPLLSEKYEVTSLGSNDVDLASFAETRDFFQQNHFDIVLNMSGKKYDVFLSKIQESDLDEIESMLKVNILGNINILANCLPQMIERKYGRIIALSSVFSEMNIPKNSIYCSTKAFLNRLISNANRENIKYGITCNTIQLGYWDGGMCYRVDQKFQEMAKQKIGLKRWGNIEELYNAVNFIIENEYVCGTSIKIDGGL